MSTEPFNCDNCNAYCCRMPAVREYGLPTLPDGTCAYLVDNKCSIYASRPLVCRIDDGWRAYFSEQMTLDEWREWNREWCSKLAERAASK